MSEEEERQDVEGRLEKPHVKTSGHDRPYEMCLRETKKYFLVIQLKNLIFLSASAIQGKKVMRNSGFLKRKSGM